MQSALITGIMGQDGSYLAELLLCKGYKVHAVVRPNALDAPSRFAALTGHAGIHHPSLLFHSIDLEDSASLGDLVRKIQPCELYHLAAPSHVGRSFEDPEATCRTIAMGTLRLLEILRNLKPCPRLLFASSSEIFGRPEKWPQDESTPFNPLSPYGVAKAFATQMVRVYRESHGIFACNAICFNHESPRRSEAFVTQKIVRAAVRIQAGLQQTFSLGDLEAKRDWGFAKDYVEAMWRMLQQPESGDYVIATGTLHSVRHFVETTFTHLGLDFRNYVQFDPKFLRPVEEFHLVGNATKARELLNWQPSVSFQELVHLMIEAEISRSIHRSDSSSTDT